jgi:hypothetical protein
MEGHSDKDHHEKTEEILAALAKRNSPSRLPVQKEEYSSPVKKQTKRAPVQSKNNNHKDIHAENFISGNAPSKTDPDTVMEADDHLLNMLISMNSRIGDLASTVDNLSTRVEGLSGVESQPFLMVPQRVRVQMNERISHLHKNVASIQSRVHALANQTQQPILMVPQYQSPPPSQ